MPMKNNCDPQPSSSVVRDAAEFERFTGRKAKISLSEPVEEQSYFEGRLAGYADGRVKMDVQGRIVELPLAAVRKAQLVVEL